MSSHLLTVPSPIVTTRLVKLWKCTECGAVNRKPAESVSGSAACSCGVYTSVRMMHTESEKR